MKTKLIALILCIILIVTLCTAWNPRKIAVADIDDCGSYLIITLEYNGDFQEYVYDK